MPLKAKFTRDEIINAGLAILRKRNMSAVTAREIGNSLGSSSRPIFTVFENMGEVIEGIKQKAREIYSDYIRQGLEQDIAFKGVGKAYIRFSIPKLTKTIPPYYNPSQTNTPYRLRTRSFCTDTCGYTRTALPRCALPPCAASAMKKLKKC